MTTFKEIRGTAIESVSSDPTNPEAGQIWYNNTIGVLKGYQLVAAAWSAGTNLSTDAGQRGGCGGSQNSGLCFGGAPPVAAGTTATEEYDGSTWTAGGNLSLARHAMASAGTQTAAFGAGGYKGGSPDVTNTTEEYDGSAWTAGGNLGTGRYRLAGAGTQTTGLAFGGTNAGVFYANTDEYDGSAWTAGGNLINAANLMGSAGIQTAALGFGGVQPPRTNATVEYDGSSWTAGGNLPTSLSGMGGVGTQNDALGFGGTTPTTSQTSGFNYNGSTWTTNPASLTTARNQSASAGTITSALAMAGSPNNIATEEWSGPSLAVKKITTS
jgi:hypothetical protein